MIKKNIGLEIIGDLKNCNQKTLYSQTINSLKSKTSYLIKKYELTELGSYYYKFDVGITAVIALAESHVAFHTWPKEKYVSLNVYVCNYSCDNSKKADGLFEDLIGLFNPSLVNKQKITRKAS